MTGASWGIRQRGSGACQVNIQDILVKSLHRVALLGQLDMYMYNICCQDVVTGWS